MTAFGRTVEEFDSGPACSWSTPPVALGMHDTQLNSPETVLFSSAGVLSNVLTVVKVSAIVAQYEDACISDTYATYGCCSKTLHVVDHHCCKGTGMTRICSLQVYPNLRRFPAQSLPGRAPASVLSIDLGRHESRGPVDWMLTCPRTKSCSKARAS
jgi:hypothetical protein